MKTSKRARVILRNPVAAMWLALQGPRQRRRVAKTLLGLLSPPDVSVVACVCGLVIRIEPLLCEEQAGETSNSAGDVEFRFLFAAEWSAALAYELTLWFARFLETCARQRYRVLNRMAVAMTLGGGWASVRNVKKSVQYAVVLYRLAAKIGDEPTKRKARVFIGWAHMWSGKHDRARTIFVKEMVVACRVEDEKNANRCEAGLLHLDFEAVDSRCPREIDSAWQRSFANGSHTGGTDDYREG